MNSVTRLRKFWQFSSAVRPYCFGKLESPWLRDNKPGPYPVTEEQKCAAAKKYGLLREEYEPYPDDGDGYGDYPKLKPISYHAKDPYYPWHQNFKLYSEPLHVNADLYTWERLSTVPPRIPYSKALLGLCGSIAIVAAIILGFSEYRIFHPVLEKQYPKPGVVHYTFELDDEAHKH